MNPSDVDAERRYQWDGHTRYYKRERGGRGMDRWYGVSEVAKELGLCTRTVRELLKRGALEGVQVHADPNGGKGRPWWRIQGRAVRAFLRSPEGARYTRPISGEATKQDRKVGRASAPPRR